MIWITFKFSRIEGYVYAIAGIGYTSSAVDQYYRVVTKYDDSVLVLF